MSLRQNVLTGFTLALFPLMAFGGKYNGPYVQEASLQSLYSLVTLAQITMPEKQQFPKYSSLKLKINVNMNLDHLCQSITSVDASQRFIRAIERAVPAPIWQSIPKLISGAQAELDALWEISGDEAKQVTLCVQGGRGQGYLDGNVDMTMTFMVKELSAEESAATYNKRGFDNIQISYSAVEWVE